MLFPLHAAPQSGHFLAPLLSCYSLSLSGRLPRTRTACSPPYCCGPEAVCSPLTQCPLSVTVNTFYFLSPPGRHVECEQAVCKMGVGSVRGTWKSPTMPTLVPRLCNTETWASGKKGVGAEHGSPLQEAPRRPLQAPGAPRVQRPWKGRGLGSIDGLWHHSWL